MNLPLSSSINNQALSSVFNHTSATYKFYWFLAIIDEVDLGNKKVKKENLFARMISNAWFPINFFKLSFGSQDKIAELISDLVDILPVKLNDDKDRVLTLINNSNDFSIKKMLFHLDKNVPHKFLSPWVKGSKKEVYEKSEEDNHNCIYQLYKKEIVINNNWFEYIKKNSKLLKDFTYWNLALFLQNRNPLIPDIVSKLIKPAKRNTLTYQRNNFWNIYLNERDDVRCIFTNEKLNVSNYQLDHFVPYSWVSHDLIWNLVPILSEFNSSKNNKLPSIDKHFNGFFNIQNDALNLLGDRLKKRFYEEYITVFKSYNSPKDFNYHKLKETIEPQISVARNNGFEFLE
ncbi:MAG: hypothetical protein LAT51_00965 [Flavobacteriaceae bacterium]|nr:hypothetical protein [Flavobacteriaceae bacterium]